MNKNRERWIYLLIGTGCGMILSGILMVIIGLKGGQELRGIKNEYEGQIQSLQTQISLHEEKVLEEKEELEEKVELEEKAATQEVKEVTPKEYVWVDIPYHYASRQIAYYLEENGIIDDREKFSQFLEEQKATTKLRTGQKYLPKNGDYDEILTILLGKND